MAIGDGLISMTPSSIAHSGTSASINADGGVDFAAVTSLSLNGVFTSAHDNYLIVVSAKADSGLDNLRCRLRVSGTDASGSNYTSQLLAANGSSVTGARLTTADNIQFHALTTVANGGYFLHFYGPGLAQPTAVRSVSANAESSARIDETASTHSLSTAYDGVTFYAPVNFTGNVHVFGYEE